jgi:hypothetical protein
VKNLIASLLACAAILPSVANAKDDFTYLYQEDIWYAYSVISTDGKPVCGMTASGDGDRGHSMVFNIKNYVDDKDGSEGLFFMINKNGWKFPKNSVKVPLSLGFDDKADEVITAEAGGYMAKGNLPMVEFTVPQKQTGQLETFLEMFAEADNMWVKFKSGNEAPWTIDMKGSRGTANAFAKCLKKLNTSRETQPYSAVTPKETQPWSAAPQFTAAESK